MHRCDASEITSFHLISLKCIIHKSQDVRSMVQMFEQISRDIIISAPLDFKISEVLSLPHTV